MKLAKEGDEEIGSTLAHGGYWPNRKKFYDPAVACFPPCSVCFSLTTARIRNSTF